MKKLKKILSKYYLRQIIACWTMCSMLLALTPARVAMALPNGWSVKAGNPNIIILPGGKEVQVTVDQMETIINWASLDTNWDEILTFLHNGYINAAVLNRVVSGKMTQFYGTLNGDKMRIFMINPAGILFGPSARINVSQLVASSLDIVDDDFLNGAPYEFVAKRDNLGRIISGDVIFNAQADRVTAERLFLIGKNVLNKGGLVAKDFVVMAAGDSVLVSEPDSSVAVEVSMGGLDPSQFKVENKDNPWDWVQTKLEADHVILAAGDLWSQAISNVKTVEIDVAGPIEAVDLSSINAYSGPGSDAVAGVSITSGSSVTIDDDITATAVGNGVDDAYSTIDISAGGDLKIKSGSGIWGNPNGEETELSAKATNGANNNAEISLTADGAFTIDAPDQVTVQAEAGAGKAGALLNQAKVNIAGESVLITGTDLGITDRPATVSAYAHNAMENHASVDIQSEGDVEIIGAGSNGDSAIVEALAKNGSENYADVVINAAGNVDIIAKEGQPTEGEETTKALVRAKTENDCKPGLINDASVDITAGGDVTVKSEGGQLKTWQEKVLDEPESWEIPIKKWDVGCGYFGGYGWCKDYFKTEDRYNYTLPEGWSEDIYNRWTNPWGRTVKHNEATYIYVDHSSFTPYVASVEAIAKNALDNTANILICVDGGVEVKGEEGGKARIDALAENGTTNTASVGIGAKGEEGVQVIATGGGEAGISSKAKNGETNTASTIVCTKGGVDVKATCGSDAGILSQAVDGFITKAFVGVCAVGNVVVQAGQEMVKGCESLIRAEAGTSCPESSALSADAETVVISHQGNVEVKAYNHGHSGIEAEAQGAQKNTAKVGVAAGADLSPTNVFKPAPVIPSGEVLTASIYDGPEYSTGNVIVEASCGSEAQILAYAHDAHEGENTADVVICAPGEVVVKADRCSEARIKSRAGSHNEEESINNAETQVYASDVKVNVASLHNGQGIWAYADGAKGNPHVPAYWCRDGDEVKLTNGVAILTIDSYEKRKDCPDCPPCPCEKEPPIPAPVAQLPPYHIPRIEGCPELTQAAAAELGIPEETLQVGMGNALALNPNIQPCQACETLVNAASILKDEDGSRMAAMIQAFNTLAPADVPYTPEMATSIAMAFENAAEGSQYASAMEFIDAFVQYAIALDELGSPVGGSKAFVMNKYGAGITGSDNANMTAFVTARIESGKAL